MTTSSTIRNPKGRESPCPRCKGKRLVYRLVFGCREIVQCHVCEGLGTVPFAPREALHKQLDSEVQAAMDRVQGRLF
jgi:hypothetical protein